MPKRKLENRTIEVILLQQDKHLWEKYQVVRVKPIFARNVLFPKQIAVPADKANLNKYQQKMEAAQKDIAKKAAGFEDLLMKIQADDGLVFERKANKEGVLYAQVSEDDLVKTIQDTYKLSIETHYLRIKKKIKNVGEYIVPFMFQDMKKDIKVTVKAEAIKEEAKETEKEENSEEHKTDA
jgi:large subunit ribosomal protein L9